uniref:Coat protein n=1 Tax=Enamovirus AEV TaxID=1770265 RepID=A0A7D6WKL5_9VIRU|nr:coat protein [Alfalfa enamovirus 1]QMD64693.1 coat protein [Alfalfa enamovirus 1]
MPTKSKAPQRRRRQPKRKAVVADLVVQPRARPRRPRRRRNRRGSGQNGSHTVDFSMVHGPFNGNSTGTIKFGPSSDCQCVKGNLNAYQKYRITWLKVVYQSEAASTDRGCIAYHVDTSTTKRATDVVLLDTWNIRSNGSATFGREILGDQPWYESNKDQFNFLYRGTGGSDVAGHFRINGKIQLMNASL